MRSLVIYNAVTVIKAKEMKWLRKLAENPRSLTSLKSICTVFISLSKVQLCNMTRIQVYVHPMLMASVAGLTSPSTNVEESCT
jgi:hypothetical protein